MRACHAAMSCEPSSSRTVTGFLPSVLSCPGHDMCTLPNPSSGPLAGAPGSPHWPAAAQLARACHFEMANCILSGFFCSRLSFSSVMVSNRFYLHGSYALWSFDIMVQQRDKCKRSCIHFKKHRKKCVSNYLWSKNINQRC